MPAIVAEQFADLDLCPGDRILEIGTGSGYSTALLCEYGAQVTSIDVLPQVISAARDRLASLDYHPKLVATDGHAGYQNNAPYDRVPGEVQVSRIPNHGLTRPGSAARSEQCCRADGSFSPGRLMAPPRGHLGIVLTRSSAWLATRRPSILG